MNSTVSKSVTITLDEEEVRILRWMLGNMSFNSYLNILNDKNRAEKAQALGGEIYDALLRADYSEDSQ